jgi:hypothetical protein
MAVTWQLADVQALPQMLTKELSLNNLPKFVVMTSHSSFKARPRSHRDRAENWCLLMFDTYC